MEKSAARKLDWISAGLLFLLLQVASARLVTTDWAPFLYWTETMAGVATVLGLALGSSRFRRGAVVALAAGYTAVILPWQLTVSSSGDELLDRLTQVGGILAVSFSQFLHRQPVKDTLFFLFFVCLAFWLIGLAAGYWLARHGRVLGSIAVAGAALLFIQAYGNYQRLGSWWLALYVLLAVLLAGRMHFVQQKQEWARDRVFVSEESGTNIFAGLFMTAVLAILAAWWMPGSPGSVRRVADTWNSFARPIRERLSNAVTSLQGPYGKPGDNFYGSSLLLGQNAALGDATVLTVEVQQSPNLNLRYYWRGRVYNIYQGGVWSASTTSRVLFHPNQEGLGIPDAAARSAGSFVFTSHFPTQSLIYAPSPAVWLDRAADVAAVRTAESVYDAFSWEARTALAAGSSYQVRAELRNPTVQQLREAGEAYPPWVTDEYLGIPGRYREQLVALAADITAEAESPYDAAVAITNYLRTHIEYAQSVPAVPEGQDPVMWVLLNHKKGFCNYYASAEVLLLRAVGIPARLAVGFARGDLDRGTYVVHRRDAHAWPEVYFPGLGWVEFEPTSSESPLARPSAVMPSSATSLTQPGPTARQEGTDGNRPEKDEENVPGGVSLRSTLTPIGRALYTGVPILGLLLIVILAHRLRVLRRVPIILSRAIEAGGTPAPSWVRNWEGWNRLDPVERLFASVTWSLRLLGRPPRVDATPAARAAELTRLMPRAERSITVLREELESGLFTTRPADLGRARRAAVVVVLSGLRARLHKTLAALDGRAVYSEPRE
jgi:transglutaminase-like putative cysteine protease